jgi:hypothetical protein
MNPPLTCRPPLVHVIDIEDALGHREHSKSFAPTPNREHTHRASPGDKFPIFRVPVIRPERIRQSAVRELEKN